MDLLFHQIKLTISVLALLFPVLACSQDRAILNDDSIIECYLAKPDRQDGELPLAIFMGGGSGDRLISYDVYRFYARELAALGWVVAVPISPDNTSFRGRNIGKIRELIAQLQNRADVKDSKTLLAGISAGGMSAIEIARRNPESYLGILAVPAVVDPDEDLQRLDGMPVYLRIGSADESWAFRFDETVMALRNAGVDLDADLLFGEPHMFGLDWDRLERWLQAYRPD